MNNEQIYKNIFKNILGAKENDLGPNYTFKNVEEWDSLRHMTLITELEDAFDIMIDTDDILHFGSYLNGIKILEKYGVVF